MGRRSISVGATLGLLAGLISACGGSSTRDHTKPFFSGSGAATSAAGSAGSAGGPGVAGADQNQGGTSAGSAGDGGAGADTDPSVGGEAGAAPGPDITAVVPSAGCGKPFPGESGVVASIMTMGVKAPDCAAKLNGVPKCGEWSTPRDYYVYLPESYDMSHAYTLIFEGPACSGNGSQVYPLENNVDGSAIRVGLTPAPNSFGHATNQNQGCFDDAEGDDSLDWAFYEALYDQLSQELCFDRNRVFAGGNNSGARMANELGCKYAGDAQRPIRGVLSNGLGLPSDPKYLPTCSNAGRAGFWVTRFETEGTGYLETKRAVSRAMTTAHCESTSYDGATFESFPIGGGNADSVCQRISGCDPLFPLVVCALSGNSAGSNDAIVNPGASTFVKLFSVPPLGVP